jgi:hypothetical protein
MRTEMAGYAAPQSSLADFVPDDTADHSAADRADRATAGKHGTADSADSGTDRRALFLRRHAGATCQADQHGHGNCTQGVSLYCFHWITSSNVNLRCCSTAIQDLPKFFFAWLRQ